MTQITQFKFMISPLFLGDRRTYRYRIMDGPTVAGDACMRHDELFQRGIDLVNSEYCKVVATDEVLSG